MADDKIYQLILKLSDSTAAGKTKWEQTQNEGAFQAVFPSHSVRISTSWGEDPETPDYIFGIYNSEGALLEQVRDTEIQAPKGGISVFQLLHDIYQKARRQAMGVDDAIDRLLHE